MVLNKKTKLRVCVYNHHSDGDAPLPRGRTIAHANVCMMYKDSDDVDINSHEPDVPVGNVPTNVLSDMYQSCV